MRTDYNVHLSFSKIFNRLFLLFCSSESGQHIHTHREILHARSKSIVMLLCQNRCRNKYCHLFPILHCLKCRPDGNFSFSESDISANQAIHDPGTLHILFGCFDRTFLIFRFLIWKCIFKFLLPYRIRFKLISMFFLPLCIQLYQILCDFFNRTFNFTLCLTPFRRSQLIQSWLMCIFITAVCILLNHSKPGCQYIKISTVSILDLNVIFHYMIGFNFFDSFIYTKSVIFMDNIISHFEICEVTDFFSFIGMFFLFMFLLMFGKNIAFCDYGKFDGRIFKTF